MTSMEPRHLAPEHPRWCAGEPTCTAGYIGGTHRSHTVECTAGTMMVKLTLFRPAPGCNAETFLIIDVADALAATMSTGDGWHFTDAITGLLDQTR